MLSTPHLQRQSMFNLGESGYEEWSQWTLCTQTCGTSVQIRTRTCRDGVDPSECSSESTQTKPCDKGSCPGMWKILLTVNEHCIFTGCTKNCNFKLLNFCQDLKFEISRGSLDQLRDSYRIILTPA